jgi:hypothetical protein
MTCAIESVASQSPLASPHEILTAFIKYFRELLAAKAGLESALESKSSECRSLRLQGEMVEEQRLCLETQLRVERQQEERLRAEGRSAESRWEEERQGLRAGTEQLSR